MSCSVPQTLYCGNAVYDQLLQVTRASLRLVDAGTRELRREWRPPAGLSIDVAAANASQVNCGPGPNLVQTLKIQPNRASDCMLTPVSM